MTRENDGEARLFSRVENGAGGGGVTRHFHVDGMREAGARNRAEQLGVHVVGNTPLTALTRGSYRGEERQ